MLTSCLTPHCLWLWSAQNLQTDCYTGRECQQTNVLWFTFYILVPRLCVSVYLLVLPLDYIYNKQCHTFSCKSIHPTADWDGHVCSNILQTKMLLEIFALFFLVLLLVVERAHPVVGGRDTSILVWGLYQKWSNFPHWYSYLSLKIM